MAKEFLTDEEMNTLMPSEETSAAAPEYLSDEEMTELTREKTLAEDATDVFKGAELGIDRGMTAGFSDELSAIGTSISPIEWALNEGPDAPFWEGIPERYEKALAAKRAEDKKIEEAAPITTTVADVASSLLNPIKGIKASTLGQAVKTGAKTGATLGGLEAAGRTEHDKLSLEAAQDIAVGAALGGTLGGGIPLIGAGLGKATEKVKGAFDPAKLREEVVGLSRKESEEIGKLAGRDIAGEATKRTRALQEDVSTREIFDTFSKQGLLENVNKKIADIGPKYDAIVKKAQKFMNTNKEWRIASDKYVLGVKERIELETNNATSKFLASNPQLSQAQKSRIIKQAQQFKTQGSKLSKQSWFESLRNMKNSQFEIVNPRKSMEVMHPDSFLPIQKEFAKDLAGVALSNLNKGAAAIQAIEQRSGNLGEIGTQLKHLMEAQDRLIGAPNRMSELIGGLKDTVMKYGFTAISDMLFSHGAVTVSLFAKDAFQSNSGKLLRARIGDSAARGYFNKVGAAAAKLKIDKIPSSQYGTLLHYLHVEGTK